MQALQELYGTFETIIIWKEEAQIALFDNNPRWYGSLISCSPSFQLQCGICLFQAGNGQQVLQEIHLADRPFPVFASNYST